MIVLSTKNSFHGRYGSMALAPLIGGAMALLGMRKCFGPIDQRITT